ncbi:MAG: nuclear transport factor 2 family protein [Chitinophagaceae bacterium]
MKTIMPCGLLLAIISFAAFVTPLYAQDATKDLLVFTKKFQDAYNKKDDKALKMMYTVDATRTSADGSVITGNEAISAEFATFFENPASIEIKQEKVATQADGSAIATGTYHVTGTSQSGEKFDLKGNYANTVVKSKGQWKISKSVLTAL